MRAKAKTSHKSKNTKSGSYRIIGGEWRSRRLAFPEVNGLRPTTDRIRETLFNWLAHDLSGKTVLDLFAGSGALGFEALSRGAASLTLIEADKLAAQALQSSIELLKAAAHVHHASAQEWLDKNKQSFDVIFLDPPFRKELVNSVIEQLENGGHLARQALIYVEQEQEAAAPKVPQRWELLREKVSGQVCYRLYLAGTGISE